MNVQTKYYPLLSEKEEQFIESVAKSLEMQRPREFQGFLALSNALKKAAEKAIEGQNMNVVNGYIGTLTHFHTIMSRIKADRDKFNVELDKQCSTLRKLIQSL
jgi:hypothetical protein